MFGEDALAERLPLYELHRLDAAQPSGRQGKPSDAAKGVKQTESQKIAPALSDDSMNPEHQYLRMAPFARFPLPFPQHSHFLTPRPWPVTTLAGNSRITHQVEATTAAHAILSGAWA